MPSHDRQKIDQYLEAIRDSERRIAIAEKQNIELPEMVRPSGGIPDTFAEHAKLMFDLQTQKTISNKITLHSNFELEDFKISAKKKFVIVLSINLNFLD